MEPSEHEPYPYPPVQHEPRIQELADDLQKAGHTPFHLPVGIKLDETDWHNSPCIKCETFDGFPCLVNAKADAQVICVDPALEKNKNLTLLRNRYVEKLVQEGSKISEVHVQHGEEKEVYRGKIVVVSCGAINSSALLLRSQIANSSGVIGKHYMCHNSTAFMAISTTPNPTKFQKTLGVSDFYFGDEEWKWPMGLIQMLGKSDANMLRGDAPKLTPTKLLNEMSSHSIDFWLTTEDLPDPENRVFIKEDGTLHLHYTPNNVESHKKLVEKLKKLLKSLGCKEQLIPNTLYLRKRIPIAGVAHQCGTVRFGTDPKTSALDVHCKAHDLKNLYVVDGSFFPSSSAVNPALTIIANSLRVGDHLLNIRSKN